MPLFCPRNSGLRSLGPNFGNLSNVDLDLVLDLDLEVKVLHIFKITLITW